MLITRECDYAVRVVRALADSRRMSVGEICEKEFITAPFAYKILKKLQKAGIVKGFRGVHGGYSLNRVAKELTLYDVYTAIDPEFFIIDCLEPRYQCTCDGSGNQACTVHRELQRVQKELCKMLQEKNLEDIFHLENRNRL